MDHPLEPLTDNPITVAEMAAIDLEDVPREICVSCWALFSLRRIEKVPHTGCRAFLAGPGATMSP